MLERSGKGINPSPESFSVLIGYDIRPYEETLNEFHDVMNSAKEKVKNNQAETLDYLEKEMLNYLFHPQIASEFYVGKRVLGENRFWDAIGYFENVFGPLQQKWWNDELTAEDFRVLVESSYLIGFCFVELGLLDKALKYLDFSAQNGKDYKYQMEYINCLTVLKDIRSLVLIEDHVEKFLAIKDEERTQEDYDFFMFLQRRRAYCLIELKEYEQAIKALDFVLKYDPENEFAKRELKYIEKVRNR